MKNHPETFAITSNTNDIPQLDLQLQDENGGDISSFITNGEWDLLGENENIKCFNKACAKFV